MLVPRRIFLATLSLTIVCATACMMPSPPNDHHWDLGVGVAPTLNSDTANLATWTTRVQLDLTTWNEQLLTVGCDARLHIDETSPIHIALVARDRWPVNHTGFVGYWDEESGGISILAQTNGTLDSYTTDAGWYVGQHEMGHALGLEHTLPIDGPSVMYADTSHAIAPVDVARVVAILGCHG